MNKKLITIAVTAALAPAVAMAADVTVYGRVHLSVDSVTGIAANTNNTALNSDSSRFGVMGDQDLGNGLKGLFQLESGVNAVGRNVPDGNGGPTPTGQVFSNARDMFIGLTGNFGSIKAGRMGGANQWVYDSNLFADQIGDAGNFNSGRGVGGRISGVLNYQTPNIGGFNAGMTYIPASSLDSGATTGKGSYGLKLDYANSGFNAHAAYFKASTTTATVVTDNKNTSIAGSYDFGNAMLTAQLVNSKVDAGGVSTTQNVYNIGGKYSVSSNGTIKAQYSKAGNLTGQANSGATQIAIGYDHNLSKTLGIYVAYAKTTNEANAKFAVDGYGHGGNAGSLAVAGEDPSALSIGMTYNF